MHAWANAAFWAERGKIATLAKHLHCDEAKAADYASAVSELARNSACEKWASKVAELQGELREQWQQEADDAREAAEDIPANLTRGFVNPYAEEGDPISQEHEDALDLFDEPEKAIAVAMEEDVDVCDVDEKGEYYKAAGREYRVLTDDEADAAWDESLDNYIDDALEIPEWIEPYFDRERWKEDAQRDGRGHHLASYDGEEREQVVEGTRYFLYRC